MEIQSETARCFSLVFLSLVNLPISLVILCISTLRNLISSSFKMPHDGTQDGCSRRTVLVTGVGMAKGLTLARAFYLSRHQVIGADFEDHFIPCSGRFSKSLSRFYKLPRLDSPGYTRKYIDRLMQIIKDNEIDLWVSCSGVASAMEDAQAKEEVEFRTLCKCIQFDVATTSMLHEKHNFMRACSERRLPVPETHEVASKDEILKILSYSALQYPDRKYILKPVGMDDVNRGDMTLLPLPSKAATVEHVSRLFVSSSTPWILQQFIPGGEEYCTHALVVHGKLRCFVACPSAELLMHYTPLPQDDMLWQDMRDFTMKFLERSSNAGNMTGHMSFDFMVDSAVGKGNEIGSKTLYPIECNPRAHTAVVLFAQQGPEMRDMVRAYISAIEGPGDASSDGKILNGQNPGSEKLLVMPPNNTVSRYWIGHDIVSLLVHPTLRLIAGSVDFMDIFNSSFIFLEHLFAWEDGSFQAWDPLPAFVLYHIYWPLTILAAWWQGHRWSRINVSTTKIFAC
ncbi:carbamoylphosphate synthase large subunit [Xylaria bambusicola]|uniref:carbamoylphosphate synthase large subunit n=1 Tax=Xylaria bambusicola TaxID=326684 RepID=UPI002007D49B|nr:carbamoylphosphate synthase large subunit [Xylaria bambusicola]KAI0517244.1 carbamoylphosphate synthase large subunit [Xylaria bambusicola]